MWFNQWYRSWRKQPRNRSPVGSGCLPRKHVRLTVEQLEGRTLLSSYLAATVSDLIADINAANAAAAGSNTITLTAPTTSPYMLTTVDNTTDGANGLPQIANKDNLTIVGNGDTIERSTASGTPAFRLFDVNNSGSLTLQMLTLQNGLAFGTGSAAEGGAIYNQGTLVLSAVTLQGNVAQGCSLCIKNDGSPAAGGGVWSGRSMTLENGTLVQNNRAIGGYGEQASQLSHGTPGGDGSGGGLYIASGTAYLTGVSINGNLALGGQGGDFSYRVPLANAFGGGLYVACGTVNLSGDTVNNNQATANSDIMVVGTNGNTSYGGGLYVAGGTVNLSGTTVNGNVAGGEPVLQLIFDYPSRFAFGGGIYVAAGTVTLSNDTVENNVAIGWNITLGGGIYIASKAAVTLCNDTVESNTVYSVGGGGIYIESGATVYIDSFTVANTINNTDSSGLNSSTANIDGSYILRNC
jgi:hypothetical protein